MTSVIEMRNSIRSIVASDAIAAVAMRAIAVIDDAEEGELE